MLHVSPCKQGYHQSQEIYIQSKMPEDVNATKQAVVLRYRLFGHLFERISSDGIYKCAYTDRPRETGNL